MEMPIITYFSRQNAATYGMNMLRYVLISVFLLQNVCINRSMTGSCPMLGKKL